MADLTKYAEVVPICPGLSFAALRSFQGVNKSKLNASSLCFSIDNELIYERFATDFGPLNIGLTYRFCQKVKELLKIARQKNKTLCFYCGPNPEAKANAAVLVGAFQVLMLKRTAVEAYGSLQTLQPFAAFRDAASGIQCFDLTVKSVVEGLYQAHQVGLLNFGTFNLEHFEYFEKVENGDSTWIVPGKLLAFSGPAAVSECFFGYKTKVPEDYCPYFKHSGVTAVIRLNRPLYPANRFTNAGLRHYELYFPDGSCPSEGIVDQFLEIVEREQGGVAIHCKAGLGRTGVLICCYMMKHYQLTAREALGYIRVCRPGSVIGHQQLFLLRQEARMHQAGRKLSQARNSRQAVTAEAGEALCKANGAGSAIHLHASCSTADVGTSQQLLAEFGRLNTGPQTQRVRPRSSMIPSFLRFKSSFNKQNSAPDVIPEVPMKGSARTTAPNGQPRKIPTALLVAGDSGLKAFAADEDQPNSAKSDGWKITAGNENGRIFSPLGAALHAST